MASSSPSSPSAQAFFSGSWTYHVFLSFRGEDTRNNFVGHLYSALEQMGIHTYKDDRTLSWGEPIRPSLTKAINESQIAIIVFSENYANSSWCLDELSHIMTCRKTRGQIVKPIFYDVDPSELRKQKRKFGEAFAKYELENNTKIDSWRKALVDASNICGRVFKNNLNRNESDIIKDIVNEISEILRPLTPRVNDNLVGIEARMHDLISKLQIGSGGVRMIGIWGVGGGGKTTLASSIYSKISWEFGGCCCIENIREKTSKNGLKTLQEEILSGVLKQDRVRVGSVEEGKDMIMDRLCRKKVLIVLDDVDQPDQLQALAGSCDWFGEGSLIIITTRDKHLLTAHKVTLIHNISLLNNDEAIKLFSKHAPRDNRPLEDYEQLLKEVVSYSDGLPLALTILGSFVCDKNIHEWKSALTRLKEIPDTNILQKLKISFDGLKPVEKELFLDIACFHRWEDKDKAMEILDGCGFHSVIGVKVLIQKALITISNGLFDMHDLVQEMGHYIVRGEHPNNPEKHSRVWKEEDVLRICAMDETTELDMIKAIRFKYNRDYLLHHLPPIVANTKNLRWIDWSGDFPSHLLSNFPQSSLRCLVLYGSLQKQLWEGYKLLPNMKSIELHGLDNLIMTPDFNGLPNLERFFLSGCRSLEEIHTSIGYLERLVLLHISGCSSLQIFPPVTRLKKLETISLSECPRLVKLSDIQQNTDILPHLQLANRGKEVSSYINSCTNFFVICWRCGCSNLPGVECCLEEPYLRHKNMKPCLRANNMNHVGLRVFPNELRKLDLSYCDLGDEEMSSAVWGLHNLKKLHLSGNKFTRLNLSVLRLPRLKCLDVSCCKNLVELSELPSSIAVVDAEHCRSLESFGDISNCKWLWNISLREENKVVGGVLLDSMLQGNASEDYFINIILKYQIPERFVGWLFRGDVFTLHLPDDWYDEFCGFLICVVNQEEYQDINIVIKQEVDEDSLLKVWQESTEIVEPVYDGTTTHVGYVSFGSLRHTALSNSSYTIISVSIERMNVEVFSNPSDTTITYDNMFGNSYDCDSYVGAKLVPRKSKGGQLQTTKVTTDCSEFWDEEGNSRKTFTIQDDPNSSIKIIWRPWD